jgi:hypothetical protein
VRCVVFITQLFDFMPHPAGVILAPSRRVSPKQISANLDCARAAGVNKPTTNGASSNPPNLLIIFLWFLSMKRLQQNSTVDGFVIQRPNRFARTPEGRRDGRSTWELSYVTAAPKMKCSFVDVFIKSGSVRLEKKISNWMGVIERAFT